MVGNNVYGSIVSARAQRELKAAFVWYEGQQKGLGTRLITELDKFIDKILQGPEIFGVKHAPYREAVMPTFPYLIIYRINKRKKIVKIFSIFHTSQNPNKKYK